MTADRNNDHVVYRIHFTIQDLARTRVAETARPETELDMAARALQDRSQPVRLDAWRRRARARLSAGAQQALSLIPPVGWSPSFTMGQAGTPEEVLEHILAAPRRRVSEALAFIAEQQQPIPSWARHLADDKELRKQFVSGVADLYAVLLDPYQKPLGDLYAADRSVRMRQLRDGGVEHLLTRANPQWLRWNPPVLEIRMANGIDRDLYLNGRGVLLLPSMFSARSFIDPDVFPQPTVSYPAGRDQPLRRLTTFVPEPAVPSPAAAVSALLGRTRAAVLNTIAEHPGCSTKELAALADIAPASASEHATILRQAGLVRTIRYRNTAVHSPTGLGVDLLNGNAGG